MCRLLVHVVVWPRSAGRRTREGAVGHLNRGTLGLFVRDWETPVRTGLRGGAGRL
jgi:hypothetical protein